MFFGFHSETEVAPLQYSGGARHGCDEPGRRTHGRGSTPERDRWGCAVLADQIPSWTMLACPELLASTTMLH